ncbi:hypothetical protein MMC28_000134 [Mycoblastus sanguinarius]|nr:hypothetical protein [Mycoblastus sanguinarius]
MKTSYLTIGTSLAAAVKGACPFAELKRSGLLGADDVAKFETVKRGPPAAEALFQAHRREAVPEPSSGGLIGPIVNGILDLPSGGGLLNGVLQPLTGQLQAIDIPTPQVITLEQIPGNDPNHQFQAPGPTDVRANAVQIGYGFAYELGVFLSALGFMARGDLVTGKYTIGGADSRVPNTIGPAGGLDKHVAFEIDGSIIRQDTALANNANFLLQRWDEYVNESQAQGGLFNAQTNAVDKGFRYDISKETNPSFLVGVAWFAVSHAERVFVYEG